MFFVLLVWIIFSIVVGYAAAARGRSSIGWFLVALFFSPIIAVLFLIAFPSRRDELISRQQLADGDRILRRNIARSRREPEF